MAIALLVVFSATVMYSARNSAKTIANDNPYCIQIATTSTAYREISSSVDLAGFRMKGNGPLNHAELVVDDMGGQELYHWSYKSNFFEEGAYGNPPIFCNPRENFLDSLGEIEYKDESRVSFSYAGYKFKIPKEYSPTFNIPSFAGIQMLILSAAVPRFEPVLEPDFRKVPTVGLDVGFGYSPLIQSWRLRADKDHQVEGQALQNGLIVEKVRGKSDSTTVQYYVEEKDGSTQTLIRCFDSMGYQCTHMFFDGEFSYYFHHMPSDLSNWKDMHERAKTVFRSFIKEKKA
ncbi:hypothetical protein [Methylomicrobium agile]|uniref:hypothetical protein n=1 Tax=Methylomicrobium agile TaxID=39774 RepID=UPI0012F63E01|nr:hypothetical protein [Methylomicrobium agile]